MSEIRVRDRETGEVFPIDVPRTVRSLEDAITRAEELAAADWLPLDLPPYRPSLWVRLRQRAADWWCARFGHDYEGGSGFNGEYTQHWYQCRRCGDGGSD